MKFWLVFFVFVGLVSRLTAKPKGITHHLPSMRFHGHQVTRQNVPEVHLSQAMELPGTDKTTPLVPDYMDPKELYLAGTGLNDAKIPFDDAPKVYGSTQVKVKLNPKANKVEHVTDKGKALASLNVTNKAPLSAHLPSQPAPIHVNTEASIQANLEPFYQDCLEAHNTFRAKHGVPPVIWSAELASSAQKWADQLASSDQLRHDPKLNAAGIGENLAFFTPAVEKCQGESVDNCVQCREMVRRWYDEKKAYDFDKGAGKRPHSVTKHFTQLVWADTAEVGVGTAVGHKYGFITVARYRPGGNKQGMFLKDVPPEGGPLPALPSSTPDISSKTASMKMASPSASQQGETGIVKAPPRLMKLRPRPPSDISNNGPQQSRLVPLQKGSDDSVKTVPPAGNLVGPAKKDSFKKSAKPAVAGRKPKNMSAKAAKNTPGRGFVHTVQATDGSQAQVYLTKNGEHAGIVFRDQIYHATKPEDPSRRTISVL